MPPHVDLAESLLKDERVPTEEPAGSDLATPINSTGDRSLNMMNQPDAIWLLLLLVAAKFADLIDGKVEGSHPDNKIQSPRSLRSAPIDEGLTRQMS
jgi:hypothetical protein